MVSLRVVEYTLIYFIQVSPVGRSARRVRLSCSGSCRLPKGRALQKRTYAIRACEDTRSCQDIPLVQEEQGELLVKIIA